MVREILEITGGVLVEDKCPRGLTEESVDRIRKGIGTGDRSASLQHGEMEGLPFYLPGRELCPGRRKASSATSAPALSLFLCVQEL